MHTWSTQIANYSNNIRKLIGHKSPWVVKTVWKFHLVSFRVCMHVTLGVSAIRERLQQLKVCKVRSLSLSQIVVLTPKGTHPTQPLLSLQGDKWSRWLFYCFNMSTRMLSFLNLELVQISFHSFQTHLNFGTIYQRMHAVMQCSINSFKNCIV